MSPVKAVTEFVGSMKGAAAGIAMLLALVGADGRKTATRLESHLTQDVPALAVEQATRDSTVAADIRALRREFVLSRGRIEAVMLSLCLQERNAIARRELECGRLESEAGIRR
jgi:hypothetical protein